MPRNKKLELDSVGIGRWMTADGRFGVLKRRKPINPMEVTTDFKIKLEYSIHSFENYDGPREFFELAPEIGRVDTFREVFPWLGSHTGEGSFEYGNSYLLKAKSVGVSNSLKLEALRVLREELLG